MPFKKCTGEKLNDITQYWIRSRGENFGQLFAENALCLDMEDLYLSGEPGTNSEASLVLRLKFNQNASIFNEIDRDYQKEIDETIEKLYTSIGDPYIHLTFSQL